MNAFTLWDGPEPMGMRVESYILDMIYLICQVGKGELVIVDVYCEPDKI